jgi:hypothetical protein
VIQPGSAEVVAKRLAERDGRGGSAAGWIEANVPPSEPIVAAAGIPTGYVMNRPVLALTDAAYTDRRWTCGTVRSVMASYRARYFVLFRRPIDPAEDAVYDESPLLSQIRRDPRLCGFEVAEATPSVVVMRKRKLPGLT